MSERDYLLGERLVVDFGDGQRVWVRVVEVTRGGTIRVVPETSVEVSAPPVA